jgi:HK97 gp10 family phage protein
MQLMAEDNEQQIHDEETTSPHTRVRIDGAALAKQLNAESGPLVKEVLKRALQVESRAKMLCPVDTGRLRSSITSAVEKEGDTIVGVVGTNVEYASYVEFGTSRLEAHPFLIPAVYAVLGGAGPAFDVIGGPSE